MSDNYWPDANLTTLPQVTNQLGSNQASTVIVPASQDSAVQAALKSQGYDVQTVTQPGTDISTPVTSGSTDYSTMAMEALHVVTNPVGSAVDAVQTGGATVAASANWLTDHAANYGLVIMGGLLAIGALLISQRSNIQSVVTSAGKLAVVAA